MFCVTKQLHTFSVFSGSAIFVSLTNMTQSIFKKIQILLLVLNPFCSRQMINPLLRGWNADINKLTAIDDIRLKSFFVVLH